MFKRQDWAWTQLTRWRLIESFGGCLPASGQSSKSYHKPLGRPGVQKYDMAKERLGETSLC